MTILLDVERPIFLHFLDREAIFVGTPRSEAEDITVIDTLTVCHVSGLSINLHPLAMYSASKPDLVKCVLALNQYGVLINTSHDTDIDSFISRRQEMYSGVPDSVPMFFKDVELVSRFGLHRINPYSMTDLLREDILGLSPTKLFSFALRALAGDRRQFEKSLDVIVPIVSRHKHAAITADNLRHFANVGELEKTTLGSIRRVLSALYQEHYNDYHRTVTATGVPQMTGFVEDLTFFPHYDVPVLDRLLTSLGWQALKNNVPHLREQILGTYHSDEHRRFVTSVHALLHACAEQAMLALKLTSVGQESLQTFRVAVINLLESILGRARGLVDIETRNLPTFYVTAEDLIVKAATAISADLAAFKSAWERTKASDLIPQTGFADLDRKLAEIQECLQLIPRVGWQEIRDALTVLVPLTNFAAQLVVDNLVKSALSETEFQNHIQQALRRDARIGEKLEVHPHVGGGIADLSFRGIRIELKTQSQRPMSLQDCRRYLAQASSYSVASGKRIAMLCVLDCSKKVSPPLPVQDCIEVLVAQSHLASPTFVITILMQANLAQPSRQSVL